MYTTVTLLPLDLVHKKLSSGQIHSFIHSTKHSWSPIIRPLHSSPSGLFFIYTNPVARLLKSLGRLPRHQDEYRSPSDGLQHPVWEAPPAPNLLMPPTPGLFTTLQPHWLSFCSSNTHTGLLPGLCTCHSPGLRHPSGLSLKVFRLKYFCPSLPASCLLL